MSRLSLPVLLVLCFVTGSFADGPPPPENKKPVIEDFSALEGPGRVWTFAGRVVDESPGGLTVTFSGIPSLVGQTAVTAADGTFETLIILNAGEQGWAKAKTVDAQGLASEEALYFVRQTLP